MAIAYLAAAITFFAKSASAWQQIQAFEGLGSVQVLEVKPDKAELVAISDSGTLWSMDLTSGTLVQTASSVIAFAYTAGFPRGVYLHADSGSLSLFHHGLGEAIWTSELPDPYGEGHKLRIADAVIADGTVLLQASIRGSYLSLDTGTGGLIAEDSTNAAYSEYLFPTSNGNIFYMIDVDLSSDSAPAATAFIKYNSVLGRLFRMDNRFARDVAYSEARNQLAFATGGEAATSSGLVADSDYGVSVYDAGLATLLYRIDTPGAELTAICLPPNPSRVIVSSGNSLRWLDLTANGAIAEELELGSGTISMFRLSASQELLAASFSDGRIEVWINP